MQACPAAEFSRASSRAGPDVPDFRLHEKRPSWPWLIVGTALLLFLLACGGLVMVLAFFLLLKPAAPVSVK